MKITMIAVLLCLASVSSQGGEPKEKIRSLLDYVASGKLTPERCALYSPVEQLGHLIDDGISWDGGSIADLTHSEAVFF